MKDSEANKEAMIAALEQMAEKLGHDPRLRKTLIPEWSLGCRRISPGEGYLGSFLLPNCDITQSPIRRITENAIHTADGKVHEVDVCTLNSNMCFPPIPWLTVGCKWSIQQGLMPHSGPNTLRSVEIASTSDKDGLKR